MLQMTRISHSESAGGRDPDHTRASSPSVLPVAALLLTYNEELNIHRCLSSIAGWCEAIHVVDSGSTDATRQICESYEARIYAHEYVDSASQWEWALRNVAISQPWIFLLDADH